MNKEELAIFIGSKIKDQRKQKGWTQLELGRKVGLGKNAISNYEKGFRSPKKDTMFDLANAFNIPIDDLFPPIHSPSAATPVSDTARAISETVERLEEPRRVIVLDTAKTQLREQKRAQIEVSDNTVSSYDYRKRVTGIVDFAASAGTGVWQDENLGIEVTFYEDDMAEDYDSIGIVMGHSMEPTLKNGDYLFVRITSDIPNGKISIWQINGENYVKKFRNNDKPYLESLNPDYDDIVLSENDEIRPLGVVVDIYREG